MPAFVPNSFWQRASAAAPALLLAAPASRSPSAGLTSCLLASAGTLSPAQRGHGAGVRGSAGAWCSRAGAQCGSDGLFIQQLASAGAPSLASCMCFFFFGSPWQSLGPSLVGKGDPACLSLLSLRPCAGTRSARSASGQWPQFMSRVVPR